MAELSVLEYQPILHAKNERRIELKQEVFWLDINELHLVIKLAQTIE